MADIEKVIKGLEHCAVRHKCNNECPYSNIIQDQNEGMDSCVTQLSKDALELLKDQQPKKGHWIEKGDIDSDPYYNCSVCGVSWTMIDGTPEGNGMKYCPRCGARLDGCTHDGQQEIKGDGDQE